MSQSLLETSAIQMIKNRKLPIPEREYKFSPDRHWRFDFAYPDHMLAIEIEGGINEYARGRHMRAAGFIKDCEKYNTAALMGWRLLRYTTHTLPHLTTDLAWFFNNLINKNIVCPKKQSRANTSSTPKKTKSPKRESTGRKKISKSSKRKLKR